MSWRAQTIVANLSLVDVQRLVAELKVALRAAADPEKAEPMRAYMKSEMPFLGVQKPARARAQKGLLDALEFDEAKSFFAAVAAIWDRAEYREERYVAIDLFDRRRFRGFLDRTAVPLFERLVTEGAWWDLVDNLSGPIGQALRRDPASMREVLRGWAASPDLWLRRSAMIAQLRFKAETDFHLLVELVERALNAPGLQSPLPAKDARFFLHKGAGWALRDYAWEAPDEVEAYLASAELPGLTRREASKNLTKARNRARPPRRSAPRSR